MSSKNIELDELDHKIIEILLGDALMTNVIIGEKVGLSPSAVNERIRKLKSHKIITKVSAHIDSTYLNMSLGAFIFVVVDGGEVNNKLFLSKIVNHASVLECHHLTGEYSYLLKVRVANTKSLEEFVSGFLKVQNGVSKTLTQVILSSSKDSSNIA
jgi:Lrp/AsnC family leucine-responsive transcriptional regulator